jgi:membrane protein implicated in regulation of membrane protease activity
MNEFLPFFWLTAAMIFIFVKILMSQPIILFASLSATIVAGLSTQRISILLQIVIFVLLTIIFILAFFQFIKTKKSSRPRSAPKDPLASLTEEKENPRDKNRDKETKQ